MNWQDKRKVEPQVICGECEGTPEEAGYDPVRLDVLNRHIQSLIDEKIILSGSYCLWRRGKVFANAALGNLACEWQGRDKFMPDTFFEIQSVTKVFVALAILKLAEDGMLYPGQPVHEWIAEFAEGDFRETTIAHLLTHTSGLCALPGVLPGDERDWWGAIDDNRVKETWIQAAIDVGLHAKPGESWIYSAVGYPLLGEIIERASGMRMDEFIRETILIPCGMTETHWRIHAEEKWIRRYNIANQSDLAMLAEYPQKGCSALARSSYHWKKEIPDAAGGLMSTGREMVRLGEMILRDGIWKGNRVLGKTALSWLWADLVGEGVTDHCYGHHGMPVVYGAGMPVSTHRTDLSWLVSDQVISHEGSGTCVFLVDKKEDFTAMFQTSFPDENSWCHEAVKGTASIIWSGLR